ncbi:DUF5018 domain-containing protein [Aquimarina sp. D1M17]|uniref:DUF5018 domain-containing protein n=1 Tax=Aquimarina acroporae TaxID=2937283 RepID=UPI0020BFD46C|nr:DUF5018 domain-containing protein [Aquimarina acroporae]MCK8521897.1 DUF5018 domain-containing protein [Aquimarina acroporae]
MKKFTFLIYLFTITSLTLVSCADDDAQDIEESSANLIVSFSFDIDSETYTGTIDDTNNTINLVLPFKTELTSLSPTIDISTKAEVAPLSGEAQNFTDAIIYTVTAENGDTRTYTVNVIAPNTENFITAFELKDENDQVIKSFFDEESSTILVEYTDVLDLTNLVPAISISENATITPNPTDGLDLSNDIIFTITSESGEIKEYRLAGYTDNLLKNPTGENNGEFWVLDGDVGVTESVNTSNIFFIISQEDTYDAIEQTIEFTRDFGEKYVMFLGDLTTEKVVEGSITRRPYFWGYQKGTFSTDGELAIEEVLQSNMIHTEDANVWEGVYDAKPLFEGVESVLFKMAQASMNGDPQDGTKSKYRDIEVRVFESKEDADLYVNKLYRQTAE